MKTNGIVSVAIVALAVSVAAAAQSGKSMQSGKGMEPPDEKMNVTYTGCVADFNHGAALLLTNVDEAGAKMAHDDMGMKSDSAMTKKEQTAVVLKGSSDLKKHVGQKVSVTGTRSSELMDAMHPERWTLTVKSLKVIAKSCS